MDIDPTRVAGLYAILNFIIDLNLPISMVDRESYRAQCAYKKVSRQYMTRIVEELGKIINRKITDELKNKKIVLIFDGWTAPGGRHYLGVFARYENNDKIIKKVLLNMAPLIVNTNQNAQNHLESIKMVLSYYNKKIDDIICMVGDNCRTNLSLSIISKVPFVGCASHRLNIAVQKLLKAFEGIIKKIDLVFMELRTHNNIGNLENFTDLKTVKSVPTRWSSSYNLINRYFRLLPAINELNDPNINKLLLCQEELKVIQPFFNDVLTKLESVNQFLQDDNCTFMDSRILFDEIIKEYQTIFDFKKYIGTDANIIKWKSFENGLIKIWRNQELSPKEDQMLEKMKYSINIVANNDLNETNNNNTWARKVLFTNSILFLYI